jgi:hypothetical protein
MTRKRADPDLAPAFSSFPILGDADPNVVVPTDVKATIARGAAAHRAGGVVCSKLRDGTPDFMTAVTDQNVQDTRDRHFDEIESAARGKQQQPPMVARLRVVIVIVDRLMTDGVPFAVGPNSKMNRMVRDWLNEKAATTKDDRKSRGKKISAGAVRALLRQVRPLLPTSD